jgi:hypothetical protein
MPSLTLTRWNEMLDGTTTIAIATGGTLFLVLLLYAAAFPE